MHEDDDEDEDEDKDEASTLHLYCRLFVQQGPWFALDGLYGRYYSAVRGGSAAVGRTPKQTLTRTPTRMRRERQERGATW